jgi:hypothetical protein
LPESVPTPDAVPIYRSTKAGALALAGHEIAALALRNGEVIVLFDKTAELDADCAALDKFRQTLIEMQFGRLPLTPELLMRSLDAADAGDK